MSGALELMLNGTVYLANQVMTHVNDAPSDTTLNAFVNGSSTKTTMISIGVLLTVGIGIGLGVVAFRLFCERDGSSSNSRTTDEEFPLTGKMV